jgi:hypothetical protein
MTVKIAKFPFAKFPFAKFPFAKFPFAKFPFAGVPAAGLRFASSVQTARSAAAPAHSNDNTKAVNAAVAGHRRGRPVLACHWRPAAGGGLECHWDAEPGAASLEPDPCRISALAYAA